LGPDRRGGVAEVAPQLAVLQRAGRRDRERGLLAELSHPPRGGGHAEEGDGSLLVVARISARCRVPMPVFSRARPPPMCSRQDASPAAAYSAPVRRTEAILSASMAEATAGFFSA